MSVWMLVVFSGFVWLMCVILACLWLDAATWEPEPEWLEAEADDLAEDVRGDLTSSASANVSSQLPAAADRCACGTSLVTCSCGDSRCPSCDPDDCKGAVIQEQELDIAPTWIPSPYRETARAHIAALAAERGRLRTLLGEAREELPGTNAGWHDGHVARGEAVAEDCLVCDIDAALEGKA